MCSALLSLLLVIFPPPVWADLTIFDVRQNLAMSASEPVYRDFIINGGSEAGLSVGMVVTVSRKLPLYDSYQNRSAGDLQLKVAKIKIIHVQRGMAVARLQSEFTRESTPILEDNFIMIGDRLDMASATAGSAGEKKADQAASSASGASNSSPAVVPAAATSLTVNSVLLSSQSAPQPKDTPPPPNSPKIDVQVMQ